MRHYEKNYLLKRGRRLTSKQFVRMAKAYEFWKIENKLHINSKRLENHEFWKAFMTSSEKDVIKLRERFFKGRRYSKLLYERFTKALNRQERNIKRTQNFPEVQEIARDSPLALSIKEMERKGYFKVEYNISHSAYLVFDKRKKGKNGKYLIRYCISFIGNISEISPPLEDIQR